MLVAPVGDKDRRGVLASSLAVRAADATPREWSDRHLGEFSFARGWKGNMEGKGKGKGK
jgi:hypothetical protein